MHVQYSSLSLYYTTELKKNNFPHGARSSAVSSEDTQRLSPHLALQAISGTFGFRTLLAFFSPGSVVQLPGAAEIQGLPPTMASLEASRSFFRLSEKAEQT